MSKKLYCFRCKAEIPTKIKRKKDKSGNIKGRCPSCKRIVIFVDKKDLKGEDNNKNNPSTISTISTTSTVSTTSTDTGKDHLILGLLSKERTPYESMGRGIHNGVFYIGTVLDHGKKQLDAVVTSDRQIYVDWGKDEYNQIIGDFRLNYRFPLFSDCMDYWWSNASIKKWYTKNYVVDLKELFDKIVSLNTQYMMYEDERIHEYTALDIMRSYFFPLFSANSRTYHHADPGSGKTNQLMIYRALSFNPISSADFSSASIYRIIESTGGTILIDDFDLLPEEQKNAIIQHIRVNYKKFKTIRADGNKKNRPYAYKSYSHLIFNNVYGLGHDRVTPERLITIRLLKHNDAKDRIVNPDDKIWKDLRDDLYVMTLQYWKEIKDCYDLLKINDLASRESEVIKPILAIAKVINEKLYQDVLTWFKELNEQEKLRDLTDDWEYILLKELWDRVKDRGDNEEERVYVKDIAETIANIVSNPDSDIFKKTLNRLYAFVGGHLKGYVLFKGGLTDGRTRYDIYKKGIKQILEGKSLFEIVEGVEVVEGGNPNNIKQKNLDVISKNQPDLQTRLQNLNDFFIDQQKKGNKITYNSLTFNFDQTFIENAKRDKVIGTLPDGSYEWRGN